MATTYSIVQAGDTGSIQQSVRMPQKPLVYTRILKRLRTPQVWSNCDEATRQQLQTFYEQAYVYTKIAQHFLSELFTLAAEQRRELWNSVRQYDGAERRRHDPTAPAYWFGLYSEQRHRFVWRTFTRVLERFEHGYRFGQTQRPVQFRCLTAKAGRCRMGVIANASEYGTVRVCPRLLSKTICVGGMVLLHELLHQELGIGDQRDAVCARGKETRCYRRGARALVAHNKLEKALRNNDNYAFFARAIYRHLVLDSTTG